MYDFLINIFLESQTNDFQKVRMHKKYLKWGQVQFEKKKKVKKYDTFPTAPISLGRQGRNQSRQLRVEVGPISTTG